MDLKKYTITKNDVIFNKVLILISEYYINPETIINIEKKSSKYVYVIETEDNNICSALFFGDIQENWISNNKIYLQYVGLAFTRKEFINNNLTNIIFNAFINDMKSYCDNDSSKLYIYGVTANPIILFLLNKYFNYVVPSKNMIQEDDIHIYKHIINQHLNLSIDNSKPLFILNNYTGNSSYIKPPENNLMNSEFTSFYQDFLSTYQIKQSNGDRILFIASNPK